MADLVGAEFPILSDQTKEVADDYGVFNLLGDGLAAPGFFIVAPDRTIRFSHVGSSISDRATSARLLSLLAR